MKDLAVHTRIEPNELRTINIGRGTISRLVRQAGLGSQCYNRTMVYTAIPRATELFWNPDSVRVYMRQLTI